jgi:hypothetical protein
LEEHFGGPKFGSWVSSFVFRACARINSIALSVLPAF